MKKKKKENNRESETLLNEENGLTISYKKNQFNEYFPNLLTEITGNKKKVKIESISTDLNPPPANRISPQNNELEYPGVIDFIRRCSTKEEAIAILDFLLKRREISNADYFTINEEISEEGGLDRFIKKHGGYKPPGYYEHKYRNSVKQRRNQN
ncbi:MAG: DUF2095 family protein [Promethearchaeota archaeon]|jgi:hypothetical protein